MGNLRMCSCESRAAPIEQWTETPGRAWEECRHDGTVTQHRLPPGLCTFASGGCGLKAGFAESGAAARLAALQGALKEGAELEPAELPPEVREQLGIPPGALAVAFKLPSFLLMAGAARETVFPGGGTVCLPCTKGTHIHDFCALLGCTCEARGELDS